MKSRRVPRNVDEYIAAFPDEVQEILQKIRETIRKAAPGAEETIAYGMPAYTLHGHLIFFAAYKHHIGIYPAPRGVEQFRKELSAYEGGKGTIQLPLDRPIPYRLIEKIVRYRVKTNRASAQAGRTRP
jgi:uncharacterized protein YdhG (YjbR/CyaY superfamily)